MDKESLQIIVSRLQFLNKNTRPEPWVFENRNGHTEDNPSEWGQEGLWSDKEMFFGAGPGYDSNTVLPDGDEARLIVEMRNNLSLLLEVAERYLDLMN